MKLDFSTFFTDFSRRRFRCTMKQKNWNVFSFSLGLFLRWGTLFLHQYQKILLSLFLWDIGGNNCFSLKNSGGQLNLLQKFYDNGESAVFRRLTAVSAELLAIFEKERRIPKKVRTEIFNGFEVKIIHDFALL